MLERIDHLATLRSSVVAFSGGEPLLHPDLDVLIRHIRSRGMMAGLITNGYLLSPKRILALNDAGLDFLQISIDNIEPDEVSKKSLRLLDTSSGSTLSTLICRKSRPAALSASIRLGTRK